MKRHLIYLLCLIFSLNSYANPKAGIYTYNNETYGFLIKVDEDELNIYDLRLPEIENWNDVWANPLASCKITDKSKNFAKINSKPPYFFSNVITSIRINSVKYESAKLNDSVDITFHFPNLLHDNIMICLNNDYSTTTTALVRDGSCHFRIKHIPMLAFSISPEVYYAYNNFMQYIGVLYINYNSYKDENYRGIDIDDKELYIEIPLLNDFTFKKYLIRGEYIEYSQNKIIWRDMEFELLNEERINKMTAQYEQYWNNRWIVH